MTDRTPLPRVEARTPTPWRSDYDDNGFHVVIAEGRYPSPYIVATGGEGDEDAANAALIVRAVNAHTALTEALEPFARAVDGWFDDAPDSALAFTFDDGGGELREVTLKDLRRARSALLQARNGGES